MIKEAGLVIEEELIAPSEELTEEKLEKYKVDIAYAAYLKRG